MSDYLYPYSNDFLNTLKRDYIRSSGLHENSITEFVITPELDDVNNIYLGVLGGGAMY